MEATVYCCQPQTWNNQDEWYMEPSRLPYCSYAHNTGNCAMTRWAGGTKRRASFHKKLNDVWHEVSNLWHVQSMSVLFRARENQIACLFDWSRSTSASRHGLSTYWRIAWIQIKKWRHLFSRPWIKCPIGPFGGVVNPGERTRSHGQQLCSSKSNKTLSWIPPP